MSSDMVKEIGLEIGDRCHIVFKAQPFAPVPDPRTQTINMILNTFPGLYYGDEGGLLRFETEGANGGALWSIRLEDILMIGKGVSVSGA